jgi:hypothetical protein
LGPAQQSRTFLGALSERKGPLTLEAIRMRDASAIVGLVGLLGLFGIPIVAILGHYGYECWKAWLEVGLKRDMVARGYTATEIVEVVAAERGTKASAPLPNVPPAKPVREPSYGGG